jgi:hypothetical protein
MGAKRSWLDIPFCSRSYVCRCAVCQRPQGRLEERLAQFAKPKLLIIDELGSLPFEPNAAHLLFVVARGAILSTNNRMSANGARDDDRGFRSLTKTA